MPKYNNVIFDLDGTLLDTLEDLKDACNHALQTYGFKPRTLEDIRRFVGNGIRMTLRRAAPEGTDEGTIDLLYKEFNNYYKIHCADKTKPFPGIEEMLKGLKAAGVQTAVVSNKGDYAVHELCERFFPGLLSACSGEKEGIARKPAPDLVNEILREMHADRVQTVYVGDSDVDIETAKNAGMDCISVTWGFRSREFLLSRGAVLCVDQPGDILVFLAKD